MSKWDGALRMLARQKRGQLILCARKDMDLLESAVRRIGRQAGVAYCACYGERFSPVPPRQAVPAGFTWVYATYDPQDASQGQ